MKQVSLHKNTLGLLALCLFYFLYLWVWVNPSLYLIRGYREFFTDSYFLWDFMGFPGYPAEYAARFLTQLYLFPFIASLLITVILFSIYQLMASRLFNRLIAFIPVFVLMLMHNDYRHSLTFDLDIGVVCLFLWLFISSLRYRRLGAVSFPLLLAAVLYLNGIGAALLFAGLAVMLCLVRKEKGIRFIEIAIGTLIVCLVFHYLFYLSRHDLYQEYVDISRLYTFPYYPFILYLSMLCMPLLCYKGIKVKPLYTIPCALLLFPALFLASDIDERRGLCVQYHALNRNWDKALDFAQTCEYPDKDVVLYTNQALYFTGKLYDDLFLYNQSFGSEGLLATEITNYSAIVPNQDVFLHLGALSLSIIWGTEAANVYGANPYVLKNLVKAYLAGGYIPEADKILNQLARGLFNKKWVTHYRTFVDNPALISQDAELNTYQQSQAPLAVVSTQNALMNLYLLMKDTKANRMAYDYLLTASLLDHKIEYFASYLTGLKDYGYTTIPKLYFEGLVYNSLYAPQSPINIREYSFDPNIMYRFNAFQADLRTALKNPKTASKTLEKQYKDTYWYYLLFRSNLPNEEKVEIVNRIVAPAQPAQPTPQATPQPPEGGVNYPPFRGLRGGLGGSLGGGLAPPISPDYTNLTIPPNIAPLNFKIEEEGDKYLVTIHGETGREITISQSSPNIQINKKEWKALLEQNKNQTLSIEIRIRKEDGWHELPTISNRIASEPIDPYLFYRDIVPTNSLWNKMAMHQRDLESFDEYKVIDNYRIGHNCMNCHTFNQNNPAEMLFHIRGNNGGTVIYKDEKLKKIDFPLPRVISAGAYCNWHPSGKVIAFALNKIKQNYYLSGYGDKMKEVYDTESDIIFYDVEENKLFSSPQISSGERVNLPAWSADGKYLYFITAPPYVVNQPNEEVQYSLMQASYDINTRQTGTPELLISASDINGSISFPTASPDGKYLFFCVADFGYFPVNNKSADLYLMNTETKAVCKPDINSNESESYITWSGNSRWFIFSSRRLDGMASKPFICHIDEEGKLSKPFVIPQKDPTFYKTDRRNFSRPELLKEKMNLTFNDMSKVIFSNPTTAGYD